MKIWDSVYICSKIFRDPNFMNEFRVEPKNEKYGIFWHYNAC